MTWNLNALFNLHLPVLYKCKTDIQNYSLVCILCSIHAQVSVYRWDNFMSYSFESRMHCNIWVVTLNVPFSNSLTIYLDGATPTKFGPSPRKSDLGPSFSRIDLKIKTNGGEKKKIVFGLKVMLLVLSGSQ